MSTRFGSIRNRRFQSRALILLLVMVFLALTACHRHYRPVQTAAPAEKGIVKRQLNADGTYYVRKGDTLYAIAFSYGLDAMEVAKLNGISSPYTIYPGQKLKLAPSPGAPRHAGSSSGVKINTVKTPTASTTRTVEAKTPADNAKASTPNTVAAPKPAPPVAKSDADPSAWKWPTEGRVVRGFVAGDPARNGLDIVGREGQPVTASAAGQVVYSGNGLIGYGELIIVKHSENMLSAYAHNRVRLVKEGDQVWAGQKIAEMGRNSSDEQLLHFEIRRLGKPVNPLNYLPGR